MAALRQVALRCERSLLDVGVDGQIRELEETREQFVVISRAAGRPAGLQQKWRADRDLAVLDHRGDLAAARIGKRRRLQACPRRVVDEQHGLRVETEALHAIGRVGFLAE